MEFERIAARCRRIVGADDEEYACATGLEYIPPDEQIQGFIQAFREELQENPEFSPLVWVARFMLRTPCALLAAGITEQDNDTAGQIARSATKASMEDLVEDTERKWNNALLLVDGDDPRLSAEIMAESFDYLEERSREFLDLYERGEYKVEEDEDEMLFEEKVENARLLLDKGISELRRRLEYWKELNLLD